MSDTTNLLRMLVSISTTPSESGRCIVVDLNLLESKGDPLFLQVRTRLRPSQVLRLPYVGMQRPVRVGISVA